MYSRPWETGAARRYSEEESSESLQSDVLRFVAILALCLAAIFALVRSIPLDTPQRARPRPVESTEDREAHSVLPAVPEKPSFIAPVVESRNESEAELPTTPPRSNERASPMPTPTLPAAAVRSATSTQPGEPSPAPPEDAEIGFSLRFESNEALESLLIGDQVELYAQINRVSWQVLFVDGKLRFRPSPSPKRFHVMGSDTVPEALVAALHRDAHVPKKTVVVWGVTLPPIVSDQVQRMLAGDTGGRLVIRADGMVVKEGIN